MTSTKVSEGNKRNRRKTKNRRFRENAKGFGKRGIYGRGSKIENDDFNYFIHILDSMQNIKDDVEEKVIMATTVFEHTKGKEIHFASNQVVCKVLETLVTYVNAENLERFFTVFAENYRPVCSDAYASHVLQKMVEIAFLRAVGKEHKAAMTPTSGSTKPKRAKLNILNTDNYNLEAKFSEKHRENCRDFVERTSKFLLNNLEDFAWDSCANHIIRTCILSLSGVYIPKIAFNKGSVDLAKNCTYFTVPETWLKVMKEFPQRLQMWPQFETFPYKEHTSALLSVICIALKHVDKSILKHFGKKILNEIYLKSDVENDDKDKEDEKDNETPEASNEPVEKSKDESSQQIPKLPRIFDCQTAMVLLETLLSTAGPKLLTQIYAMLFVGRIKLLAMQPLSNFAVQRLLQHVHEKEDMENIFNELSDSIEDLLKIGHTGVVEALANACLRLVIKQSQLVVALQRALHVAGDREKNKFFLQSLLHLKPYDVIEKKDTVVVHLHGSLIVQHILHYNKPILMVNCILEIPAQQLVDMFNTPNGSHIADAFLQSKFIGEKSREKFLQHLDGFYLDLAITKSGSRVVEHCFAAAQEIQKVRIAKELSDKFNMLNGSPFGRVICNVLLIPKYRLSVSQWKASLKKPEDKVDQIFKAIID